MHVAPIDGGPARPFWPAMPSHLGPTGVWPDGNGGWLVATLETFDDGLNHRSIHFLDASGAATRAACDPSPTAEDAINTAPAFTADAVYLVNEEVSDPSAATWQIVKIPRP